MVFITINLYNFILCILNNFLKTYLKIITEGFTDGIYPSAFDSSCHNHRRLYRRIYWVDISHSPTDLICRYLTVPATMTDECTDRYLWSVFQTLTDNFIDGMYPSVCHTITDGINPLVYLKREIFFWRTIFVCKTIGKCFFVLPTNIVTNGGITDERKADGRILSMKKSVNKLPTNS